MILGNAHRINSICGNNILEKVRLYRPKVGILEIKTRFENNGIFNKKIICQLS